MPRTMTNKNKCNYAKTNPDGSTLTHSTKRTLHAETSARHRSSVNCIAFPEQERTISARTRAGNAQTIAMIQRPKHSTSTKSGATSGVTGCLANRICRARYVSRVTRPLRSVARHAIAANQMSARTFRHRHQHKPKPTVTMPRTTSCSLSMTNSGLVLADGCPEVHCGKRTCARRTTRPIRFVPRHAGRAPTLVRTTTRQNSLSTRNRDSRTASGYRADSLGRVGCVRKITRRFIFAAKRATAVPRNVCTATFLRIRHGRVD